MKTLALVKEQCGLVSEMKILGAVTSPNGIPSTGKFGVAKKLKNEYDTEQ